jgi:PAS domain S-box-containing protein
MDATSFRQWSNLNDDALLLVGADGVVIEVNDPAEALLGRSRKVLAGSPLQDLVVDAPEHVRAFLGLASRTRQFVPGTLDFILPDRSVLHGRCDGAATDVVVASGVAQVIRVRDKAKSLLGFALISRERHIAELAREVDHRKAAQESLREERERLKTTLGSIADAVITTDPQGAITYMNPRAELLTGWSTAEALSRPLVETFRIISEQTRQTIANPLATALAKGEIVGIANHTVLIRKDGGEVSIDDSAAPICSKEGGILGAVLVFRDVSERRRIERALRLSHTGLEQEVRMRTAELTSANADLKDRAQRLAAANAELEQFAYIAAHDLQEPLRMIVSYLQLALGGLGMPLEPKVARYFDMVDKSARRMQEMVRSILDFSTIGRSGWSVSRVGLSQVLRQATANLDAAIAESGAEIEIDDLPAVSGCEAHLVRVFQNLLSNAMKFRSAAPPRIRISARSEGDTCIVSVADNGIGIIPGHGERLFGLFQRLDTNDSRPGVGIGLASCKKIIEQHGGAIWFTSAGAGGTTFSFSLPARATT